MRKLTNQTNLLWLYIAAFFVAWTIRGTVLFSIDKSISSPALGQLYADVLRVFIWVLPVVADIAWVDKKKPFEYLRLDTVGHTKDVISSVLVIVAYFALVLFINSVLANHLLKITIKPLSNSWLDRKSTR